MAGNLILLDVWTWYWLFGTIYEMLYICIGNQDAVYTLNERAKPHEK